MPRGGNRAGAGRKAPGGRKAVGGRVAILVRIPKELEEMIEAERVRSGGKSLSSVVERLLRSALTNPESDADAAEKALGFVLGQSAVAANHGGRTWQNDPATAAALKLAAPLIIDHLAGHPPDAQSKPHHFFTSPQEHARMIFFWVVNRLKERGDEYGADWPPHHALRNFPKAAAALTRNQTNTKEEGGDGDS